MDARAQLEHVSDYYGRQLQSSADLLTSACCPVDAVPSHHESILSKLHPEITSRFYGCGSPIPTNLHSATLLDLGCGTGRDAYLASALVGPSGRVIGVDMTTEQLDIARAHLTYHAHALLNSSETNVDFRHGFIEDLSSADIQDNSIDVVISNCVCNLSPHKSKVFAEIFRVLKPGGELYFSDVYADRRLTEDASTNPTLVAECLGGALYFEDFRRKITQAGFTDVRVFSASPVYLNDTTLLPLVKDVRFFSATMRAFKLQTLEDRRENYGQTAVYSPQSDETQQVFKLDVDNVFNAGEACPIDTNTANILKASRFSASFNITSPANHLGIFTRPKSAPSLDPALDTFRPPEAPAPQSPCAKPPSAEPAQTKSSCCAPPKKKTSCC